MSAEEQCSPLVIYDGNHRAIAQYFSLGSVQDVPAFVSVHPRVGTWSYVPPLARAPVSAMYRTVAQPWDGLGSSFDPPKVKILTLVAVMS